eukprot:2835497-Rhodomonas_salina.1
MPRTTRRGALPLFSDSLSAPAPGLPSKPVAVEASCWRCFFEAGALAAAAFATSSALARSKAAEYALSRAS